MLGGTEILIICGVFGVLLFGPSFLRKLGTASGDTIREFKKVKKEFDSPIDYKSDTGHPMPGHPDYIVGVDPAAKKGN